MKKKLSFWSLVFCITVLTLSGCKATQSNSMVPATEEPTSTPLFIFPPTETPEADIDVEVNNLSKLEAQVISITEKTRGLKADKPLAPVYISRNELRDYMKTKLSELSDEEIKTEQKLYKILSYIPDNFDLRKFYLDLYSSSVAGFYETDKDIMYLLTDASAEENARTLAHEYTHYLQYHNTAFREALDASDKNCNQNADMCMIIDAVVEGDAVLTESLSNANALISQNKVAAASEPSSIVNELWIPDFFMDTSNFPYQYGYKFVSYMYSQGGYDKVNSIYENPPESVEQLMHPEKYLLDKPVFVDLTEYEELMRQYGFTIIRENTLNEADLLMLLTDAYKKEWQVSKLEARTSAAGWGGGAFLLAENDGKILFVTKITFDTENDANEAEMAFADYSAKRFGQQVNQYTWINNEQLTAQIKLDGNNLTYIIAPSDLFGLH